MIKVNIYKLGSRITTFRSACLHVFTTILLTNVTTDMVQNDFNYNLTTSSYIKLNTFFSFSYKDAVLEI